MRKSITIVMLVIACITGLVFALKPTPQWCYQQGMKTLDDTSSLDIVRYAKANLFFRMAINLDPKYAPPYYDLIRDYLCMAYLGTDDENKDVYSPAGLAIVKKWINRAEMIVPDTAEMHFCKAQYIFSLKQYDEAAKEIQKAIAIDPNNGRYYFEDGQILFELYLETKEILYASQAIKELKRSLDYKLKPRFRAAVYDYLGMVYDLAFNKKEVASNYYALSQNADSTDYISRMHQVQVAGSVEQNTADMEKRRYNFGAAVKEFSAAGNTKALYETAKEYADCYDFRRAEAILKQVIEKEPRNYQAVYMLGSVYLDEGNIDKALEQCKISITLNRHFADGYSCIGYIYYLKNDWAKAIDYNLKSVYYDPKNTDAYFNLGMSYYRGGKVEEAIQYFNKCLEINPRNDEVYYMVGRIYYEAKNKSKAEEYLQNAIDLNTNYEDAYFKLGNIYMDQKAYPKAIPLLEKAMYIEPFPLLANNLSWSYVCMNQNQEEAVELAEYAVAGEPNNHHFLDTLNKAYINLGDKYKSKGKWLSAWQCYRKAKKAIKRDYS